jgi:hypothetical protein
LEIIMFRVWSGSETQQLGVLNSSPQ